MDHQLKNESGFIQSIPGTNQTLIEFRQPQQPPDPRLPSTRSQSRSSQENEGEVKDCVSARKTQKADREKLRRDRLNEHFNELGNALDPDRPKNDKATILADTIQLLKDLTSHVEKLKAEHATLTEESRELTQEKNDLREEKASLRSDIENLNIQYHQRVRTMVPWAAMDHSVVMPPPSYPYPVPMPISPGAIPVHPTMQPYPMFGNQNHAAIPNHCSTFVPFVAPNTLVEQQQFTQYASTVAQPSTRSQGSAKQDSGNKSLAESKIDKTEDSNDVTTDLELKTPGSTTDQDLSSGQRKSKRSMRKENSVTSGNASSRCSSSRSVHSSSDSVADCRKADDLERT